MTMLDDPLKLPSRFQLWDEVSYGGKKAVVYGVSFCLMDFNDEWGYGGKVCYDLMTDKGLIQRVLSNDVSPRTHLSVVA